MSIAGLNGTTIAFEIAAMQTEAEIFAAPSLGWGRLCKRAAMFSPSTAGVNPTCVTVASPSGQVVVVGSEVTWGPAVGADGLTHYGSAALQLKVDLPGTADDIDLYVGYVDVAVLV